MNHYLATSGVALALAASGAGAPQVISPSLEPRAWTGWRHDGSRDAAVEGPVGQTACGQHLCVVLPSDPDTLYPPHAASLDYLQTRPTFDLRGKRTITARFKITMDGSPRLNFAFEPTNSCRTPPASVRLILAVPSRGWMSGHKTLPYTRWWNTSAVAITPGTFTLAARVADPEAWSSVYGERASSSGAATAGFEAALARARIGFSFGGGCFYGHGVGVTGGGAAFELVHVDVE